METKIYYYKKKKNALSATAVSLEPQPASIR